LWAHAAYAATVAADLLQQVIDAARADAPNETVGLLIAAAHARAGGVPMRYVRLANAAASPYRYTLEPEEQTRLMLEIDDAGEVVWAIVHSHLAAAAVPSPTDIEQALYPDSLYLICSLAEPVPVTRAWSIRDNVVLEVSLAVG
jgi:proteasome lid subunit RPN8/RPN11